MARQKLWAQALGKQIEHTLHRSIRYHSPELERCGRNRTGHAIQPHHVASAPASGLLTASANLTHRPHRAKSWLLRPGSGPRGCSAWSQEPGTRDAQSSDRQTRRSAGAEIPQLVALRLCDQSGPGHPHTGCTGCGGLQKRPVLAGYLASTSCSRRCSIVRRRAWNFMVSLIISLSSSSFNFSTKLSSTGISNLMY